MLTVSLAMRLREAGLRWQPARGDRFVIPGKGMDSDVFVLSDMTVELHDFPAGPVIGFNGTVEWALDSVEIASALWLPTEQQLRERLAGTFVSLTRVGDRYRVDLEIVRRRVAIEAGDPEEAYAQALLHLILGEPEPPSGLHGG
jgi:hypothetical protein